LSRMPHMGCWTRRSTRLPTRFLCIFVLNKSSSPKWVPSARRTRRGGSHSAVFYAGFWNTIVNWWFMWLTSDRFKRHLGYRGSTSTFVRVDRHHICHVLVSELGNFSVTPKGVELDGGHCSRFGHSLYCGCCAD
jgi:hypothetical protein